MILESRFAPSVSTRSMFVIALLAFLVLPSFIQNHERWKPGQDQVMKHRRRRPRNRIAPTTSEFPYAVQFEQGATRFLDGDKITILEVRGTADTFAPGNLYWIKGTYTLASHDQAMLAAFTSRRWTPKTGKALISKSRRPSSIRATVRSRSSCRCHTGVGRMSVFTRPMAEEVSAATILERAIPS